MSCRIPQAHCCDPGFGFVTFTAPEAAQALLNEHRIMGLEINGKRIDPKLVCLPCTMVGGNARISDGREKAKGQQQQPRQTRGAFVLRCLLVFSVCPFPRHCVHGCTAKFNNSILPCTCNLNTLNERPSTALSISVLRHHPLFSDQDELSLRHSDMHDEWIAGSGRYPRYT